MNKFLNCLNLWKKLKLFSVKITVEVLTYNSRPVVPHEHAVWIDHWNNEKDIVLHQLRSFKYL